ncbi:MAG: transporter substrate-binding domain-containing protein [Lachnospiraceae bacterium]|nr:transporter substrate-binding domain-containing protein [Lachnospiraceae bacterium]
MKRKVLAILMTIATVAVMTGCGGSKSAESAAPASEAAPAASEAPADAGADKAAGDKVWIIATDTSFKPFEYTDDKGQFVGIDMDILAAVAEDQGFKYDVQVLGWDASIAACQAGQADGLIAGASITDERKSSGWIFSDGYYDANQSMAVEASSDIKGFEDLKGKSVAVKTGSMSASYAESLAGEYGFTVTYFEDSPTMYQAVVGGQVAACFDDTPIMASNIKDTGIAMKIVDGTGNDPAAYGFAIFDSSKQELVDMFNKGLANIKENGKYDEILNKYLGE